MRITRIQAYQAHPVPSHVYYPPDDPLEPDITAQPEYVVEGENPDYEERVFRCKHCRDYVLEFDIEDHECDE
jgi:hypothetical protein